MANSERMNAPSIAPTVAEQIVAFVDLKGFHSRICVKLNAEATFEFLAGYYATAQRALAGTERRVVKFIGDAILVVFPATHPREAVAALDEMKQALDAFLVGAGHDSRVRVKAHIGSV